MAVPSSGLHSNGFSLVRYLLKEKKINIKKNNFLKKELIRPTKIYAKEILDLINKDLLNSCANITGGGLADNISRIIPNRLCAEMLKTFNCGVGFCLIINSKNLNKINKYFSKQYKPYVIGKVSKGRNKVKLNGCINWL